MVRWITGFCLCVCLGALSLAQAPKEQANTEQAGPETTQSKDSVAPSSPAASKGSAPASTASSAKTEYPLDSFKNFSATMIGSMAGGDEESPIYRLGNLMRTAVGGSYTVTDLVKGDTWGVSPKACLHENHPAVRVFPFDLGGHGRKIERVAGGKETVDGHSCNIEDVTVTSTTAPIHSLKLRFWEAEDLQGFPIKVEVVRVRGPQTIIRYKDVVLTAPDAALFKHPKNCDKLAPDTLPTTPPAPAPKKPAAPKTPTASPAPDSSPK